MPAPNAQSFGAAAGPFPFVPGAAGTAGAGMSYLMDASDFDEDGDPDFLTCDDFGGLYSWAGLGQVLWRNDGAAGFVDVTAANGVTAPASAMGCTWGDVDRDGDFDYFVSNDYRGHILGVNQLATGGGFADSAVAWGVVANQVGWGCSFFDYDADGFVDL